MKKEQRRTCKSFRGEGAGSGGYLRRCPFTSLDLLEAGAVSGRPVSLHTQQGHSHRRARACERLYWQCLCKITEALRAGRGSVFPWYIHCCHVTDHLGILHVRTDVSPDPSLPDTQLLRITLNPISPCLQTPNHSSLKPQNPGF